METSRNLLFLLTVWGFPESWGYPNSWLVYSMENPIEMDDLAVTPTFGNLHICPLTGFFTQEPPCQPSVIPLSEVPSSHVANLPATMRRQPCSDAGPPDLRSSRASEVEALEPMDFVTCTDDMESPWPDLLFADASDISEPLYTVKPSVAHYASP